MIRSVGKIRQDFRDSFLSEEEYKVIDKKVVQAVRKKILMRKLFPEWFKPPEGWAAEYGYDLQNDLSDAQIDTIFRSLNVDTLKKTRATAVFLKIEKDFHVQRASLERAREKGRNAVVEHAVSAAYKVALAEDNLILTGWSEDGTNYEANGIYEAAGNDYSTAKTFGTFLQARDAVSGAIALIQTDNFHGPYKCLLTPLLSRGLRGSCSTTGVKELPLVNQLLNDPGYGKLVESDLLTKRVFSMPLLPAGKGLVISEDDEDIVRVVPGVPLTVETYDKMYNNGMGVAGRVFLTEVVVVIRPDAFSKMSNLS